MGKRSTYNISDIGKTHFFFSYTSVAQPFTVRETTTSTIDQKHPNFED